MNQRIRYTKNVDGIMVGSKFYRSKDGREYTVQWTVLDGDTCAGIVRGPDGFEQDLSGTSPHKIKIAIKRALVDLGCEFEKETRTVTE